MLARLAGKVGCDGTSRYTKNLPQEHLAALGAWQDRGDPLGEIPSSCSALAAHGERFNRVNRTGAAHQETVKLVSHADCIPVACRVFREEGGEQAAVLDRLGIEDSLWLVSMVFQTEGGRWNVPGATDETTDDPLEILRQIRRNAT